MTYASLPGASPARTALAALLALALAGCQNVKDVGSEVFSGGNSVEAAMAPVGNNAATGVVKFNPTGSGVAMLVHITGLLRMEYRVVIHSNGNCSSPNGFAAGPPWIPPGAVEHATAGVPPAWSSGDYSALTMVVRIAGLRVDGPNSLAGKAVILHAGAKGSLDAEPGVPNNRIACGVVGPVRSFF